MYKWWPKCPRGSEKGAKNRRLGFLQVKFSLADSEKKESEIPQLADS